MNSLLSKKNWKLARQSELFDNSIKWKLGLRGTLLSRERKGMMKAKIHEDRTQVSDLDSLRASITQVIATHLDLYEPVAESLTDEIVDLLRRHISC